MTPRTGEVSLTKAVNNRRKLKDGRSCQLDRPRVLSRHPLEPGEMVTAWLSQERGTQGGGEDYHVRSCPSRFKRPRN